VCQRSLSDVLRVSHSVARHPARLAAARGNRPSPWRACMPSRRDDHHNVPSLSDTTRRFSLAIGTLRGSPGAGPVLSRRIMARSFVGLHGSPRWGRQRTGAGVGKDVRICMMIGRCGGEKPYVPVVYGRGRMKPCLTGPVKMRQDGCRMPSRFGVLARPRRPTSRWLARASGRKPCPRRSGQGRLAWCGAGESVRLGPRHPLAGELTGLRPSPPSRGVVAGVSERGSGRSVTVALCAPLCDRLWR
jgi:hypothetical protein